MADTTSTTIPTELVQTSPTSDADSIFNLRSSKVVFSENVDYVLFVVSCLLSLAALWMVVNSVLLSGESLMMAHNLWNVVYVVVFALLAVKFNH
jgi:hypothetical protein